MSKILFINGDLHGHINPTLPVVSELVHRGEEVYYCSTREFQAKLEAAGAVFMDYGDEFNEFNQNFRPHGNHPFYTMMEYMLGMDLVVVPIVLRLIQGITFDCIIHDVMFGGGNVIAKQLHLPSISSCSSFVMEHPPLPSRMLEPGFHPQLDYLLEKLREAGEEWKMDQLKISDVFYKKADKVIVYTSRMFQPMGDVFDQSYFFVGPSIMDRAEELDFKIVSGKGRLVYISMGSIMNNQMEFYLKCIDAFKNTDDQVVISVGNKICITDFEEIPSNIIIRNYVPQLEILKHCDVMISHGGLNSVSEALYYGVPVITIPLVNDQPAVAKRLTELGAGLQLSMTDITSEILLQKLNLILSDPSYAMNCQMIQDSFRSAGGYQYAADKIQSFIYNK